MIKDNSKYDNCCFNNKQQNSSSPLRGEVGAYAPGGGVLSTQATPSLILPPTGGGKKPFTKATRKNAIRLRNNLTEAEKKLWYFIRNKQLSVKFRRQQPIGKYIVDFISFDCVLIIELDGGQHGAQQAYDEVRDAFLRQEGFTVLRFWNNDVMENIEEVLQMISNKLRHLLPASPLKGEECIREAL